jgi:glutamyl-tRNA synthetase
MINLFDLPQIGRSPARFDFAKLESVNGYHIRHTPDIELVNEIERVLPHLAGGEALAQKLSPTLRAQLVAAMPNLKERAKTLVELVEAASYIHSERPIAIDPKAAAVLGEDARVLLADLVGDLDAVEPWIAASIEECVRRFAEKRGVKLGSVAQPLRAALTGRTTSPGIFDVLSVLGKAESLARIRDQIPKVRPITE